MSAVNTPLLQTERLRLRKFSLRDLDSILHLFGDKEVNEFLPWFPVTTREEARGFYEQNYLQRYQREAGYHYAICLKTEDIPIGWVQVRADESMDLGYGLAKEFWYTGIVTEACVAVLERVKQDGYLYVTATHDVNNTASGRVMQKLQMQYMYTYQELWQPKNKLVTFRMYQLNFDGDSTRVYRNYWELNPVHYVEAIHDSCLIRRMCQNHTGVFV
ncbi:MAG TPA: GNAT family N-acetyltransferase [Sphaerochaeta sp.]|nr:GNAT family N-acetyltransferase [Sphaerochaeta sp.]